MKTSYLFQTVNLLSSLLLLVLILAYLDPGRYLQWVLFTTIAGAAIQLESSLSVITVRYLGRTLSAGGSGFDKGRRTAAGAYKSFSLSVAAAMLVGGGAYLAVVDEGRFSPTWPVEWAVFCAAYLIYYIYAHHCCVLIALGRASSFAAAALVSRILNVFLAFVLVVLGRGILGLVASMTLSFVAGAAAYRVLAARAVDEAVPGKVEQNAVSPAAAPRLSPRSVLVHAAFIIGSYSLYRIGFMIVAATTDDTAFQASYGLALQLFALLVTVALVPLYMHVTPLVAAVAAKDKSAIAHEMAKLSVYTNIVFLLGATSLVMFAGAVDEILPSRGAKLPETEVLAALACAFLLEINIFVLVNVLLAAQRYRFAQDYYLAAGTGLALGLAAWTFELPITQAWILIPALAQVLIGLPAIAMRVRRETGVRPLDYAKAFVGHALLVLRHPIKVGLAFR